MISHAEVPPSRVVTLGQVADCHSILRTVALGGITKFEVERRGLVLGQSKGVPSIVPHLEIIDPVICSSTVYSRISPRKHIDIIGWIFMTEFSEWLE